MAAPAMADKRTAANPPAEPPIEVMREAAEKGVIAALPPVELPEGVPLLLALPVVAGVVGVWLTMTVEKPVLETGTDGVADAEPVVLMLALALRLADEEDAVAEELGRAVVAAPIENVPVVAKTSVILPMFTASMV
jgi:hypothetical protein